MLRFIVIVKFQSQRPDWRVVREQRLFGHNPNVACICHVVDGGIAEYYSRIVLAVGWVREEEAGRVEKWEKASVYKHI